MLGSPGGFNGGSGSRFWRRRLQLVENGLPAPTRGLEREAVGCNRVAEQGSDCSIIFGGKIRLHGGNMRRKGF